MTYTALLMTEDGKYLTTEDGARILAENTVEITPQPPYPAPVVLPRDFPVLKRGVNLAGWYTLHGQDLIIESDLIAIKKEGFDHVRLNVAPGWTDTLPAEGGPTDPVGFGWSSFDLDANIPGLPTVKYAVDLCLSVGLDVILDVHVTNTNESEKHLDPMYWDTEPDPVSYVYPYQIRFCLMWQKIAEAFKDYPQNRLAYEIFNEPQFYGFETNWFDFRNGIIAAIRQIDKLHYLISPTPWGGGTGYLWRNENVADSAHGFAIHSYEPFDFTHRLTDWTGINSKWNWVLNLKYPTAAMANYAIEERPLYKADYVSNEDFVAYLTSIGYPASIPDYVQSYIDQNWTEGSYDWIADYVADYGAARANAKMFLNEFGAFKPYRPMKATYDPLGDNWSHPWKLTEGDSFIDVDENSRSSYLLDARKTWESRNLSWTVFAYAGNFGITELSGDIYWRDNGEKCPVYGGNWTRSFTVRNLNALIPQYVWYEKCQGQTAWQDKSDTDSNWTQELDASSTWVGVVEDDAIIIPCSG